MIDRVKEIKEKGFNMADTRSTTDFAKIKVGVKSLDNAHLILGDLKKVDARMANKEVVLRAIHDNDLATMRQMSELYYRINGIYNRLCRYAAYMYRYDWYITPYIGTMSSDNVLKRFNDALYQLDNFQVKKTFGEIALKVIKQGCYYCYLIPQSDRTVLQELPVQYCRSRFTSAEGRPVVEFNMKYFDDAFKDAQQKMKMLKIFPDEFKKGYILYKEGKLLPDFQGDTSGWYLLDTEKAYKFNFNGDDFPMFISVIPALIDLDEANDLDKQKMQQQLLKIIIQKMPIDKNGDLVFDVEEAKELHNNAVRMLGKAVGVDVLTTFAETEVAEMSSNSANTAADESMSRVRDAVFDQAGVSQNQFNTDGNMALEKSVLNDEASLYNLIQQFEQFLNVLLKPFNTAPKKVYFRAQILGTTIYNYKELAKLYKEQVTLGYSKMLPQIALGQSQSSILANAYFENDVLDLLHLFIPPLSSNTMSSDILSQADGGEAGRPEKANDEKSTKTIQNIESMS